MSVQILVVKPKVLNAADKKLLRESGVVCIEATDPAAVRFLNIESPPMNCNDMFRAAMLAIAAEANTNSAHCRATFAANMAAMVKANAGNMKP